jgi:two-component system alkaline phosphatase synthesis response regulator PhoP
MIDAPSTARTILVVEDDEHIGDLLRFLFERQGFEVEVRTDGRAALAYIEASVRQPRLILLDVMLPFVDGFELVKAIRARAGWESIPVLMLTAKASEADIARARAAGATDYLLKPFQPNELMARVRRYLRQA